jgi:ComF family protein
MPGNRKQIYLQHNKYNMSIIERIIGFLAPYACLRCGTEEGLLCAHCMQALPPVMPCCYLCRSASDSFNTCSLCSNEYTPQRVWIATSYTGSAKRLVRTLKFDRAAAAADVIARALAVTLPVGQTWTVTHAPTAYARVRQRGYDQAQLIARQVACRTGTAYAPLLARQGTQRQLGQSRAIRRQQMASAFRVISPISVIGRDILLIDDVLTTGSTLSAASHTLYAAGARTVTAAVFAAA